MDAYRRYLNDPLTGVPTDDALGRSLASFGYGDEQKVVDQLDQLLQAYGEVTFGSRHSANCSTWRAERVQLNDEHLSRFAHRVHIFQRPATGTAFGRYIGYVSLRPYVKHQQDKGFPYVAVAHLVVPRFMLRPRYHIITCVDGPADGVLPLKCVPFCSPNRDTNNRASCLHAAVQEALLLKMNTFDCFPITSQDMLALLWERSGGAKSFKHLRKGATLRDARDVIVDKVVRGGAVLEAILEPDVYGDVAPGREARWVRQEAHRCITDYLANGLPIIIEIPRDGKLGHSMLVFGMHLLREPHESGPDVEPGQCGVASNELPGRFVVHDSSSGPFHEIAARDLLDEAYRTSNILPNRDHELGVTFLAVCPPGTNKGIYSVRRQAWKRLWQDDEGEWASGRTEDGKALPLNPRMVTRLLRTEQVLYRYGSSAKSGKGKLAKAIDGMTDDTGYWWSVEVHAPSTAASTFSAAVPPLMVYAWLIGDDVDVCEPRFTLRRASDKQVHLKVGGVSNGKYEYLFRTA